MNTRILFVTHSFPPPDRPLASVGGMQRVAFELDAALRDKAARRTPTEFAFRYTVRALVSSWRWVHLKAGPFLVGTWWLLRRGARRREMDVVVFSSMVTAALAVPLAGLFRRNGIRTAAIVHGQDVTKPVAVYQWFVPRVFRALDVVMPVSGATGEACVERGLAADKVTVVHNGVDVERFDRLLARLETSPTRIHADRAALPAGSLGLCSVGRQVKRKGFAWFIRNVMPTLPAHVHYWLGGDGPEREDILAAIEETGLSDRVRLLGRLSEEELVDLYRSSDLFIMPNIPVPGDMEGFGIVMLEAGLTRLPTVAARLEGIREVVTPGENGYFVETGDAEGFTERILALDTDRTALDALSLRTEAHIRRTFSWSAVAENYLRILTELPATGAAPEGREAPLPA